MAKAAPANTRKRIPAEHLSANASPLVSLFSGPGGLDLGFEDAGFPVLLAVDHSAAAVETWNANRTEDLAIQKDLESAGATATILSHIPEDSSIGIVGGPPCQGFSRARTNSQNGQDPRRRFPVLFADLCLHIAQHRQIDFVVMENVAELSFPRNKSILRKVRRRLRTLNLATRVCILDAQEYGIPQIRKRLFLVCMPSESMTNFKTPAATNDKPLTLRAVIKDLPKPSFNTPGKEIIRNLFHPNHCTSRPLSSRFKEKRFNRWRSFRRLDWDKPSPTVAYGNREIHVHPSGDRRLSVYEAMLLQGFPEDFEVQGTFSEQVTQVSNAVPPPLAFSLARAIKSALQGTEGTSNGHSPK